MWLSDPIDHRVNIFSCSAEYLDDGSRYVAYHDSHDQYAQYILYFPADDGYAQQDDGGPYPARTYDAGGLQKWEIRPAEQWGT
jgi:hypothetical protein